MSAELRFLSFVDGLRPPDDALFSHVESERARIAADRGLSGDALRDALVDELAEAAAVRSAAIGALAALPFALPFAGPWLSLGAKVTVGTLLQVANEVALVHQIAGAYGTSLDPERRRMVAWWLVRLSNFEDLHDRAADLGVKLSVRRLVEKLIAVGVTRAAAATAGGMMAAMAGGRMGRRVPWYVSATGFLGVPVLAVLGWRSTLAVADRAREYFGS